MRLKGKLFIEGKIKLLTGLSIGGSDTNAVIGGLDNGVIKNTEGIPYIPGSSLKGKIRSLLEKEANFEETFDNPEHFIGKIFGTRAGKRDDNSSTPTRLYIRDAMLNGDIRKKMENKEGIFKNLELEYTEVKWENTIDRKTSEASHPRQTERVPAGAEFDFSMVYNILEDADIDRFNKVLLGLKLLEDDYLGANGSRGYGRIQFENFSITIKTIKDYEGSNTKSIIYKDGNLNELNFDVIKEKINDKLGAE